MSDTVAKPEYCSRCGVVESDPERCWFCMEPLCSICWDAVGHCGHPEAEAINEQARALDRAPAKR